jgi:IS6 family transposase
VTVYRWVQTFTPEFIDAARASRHAVGDRWFVDETYVKVAGRWTYLYRAVDQHGQASTSWSPSAEMRRLRGLSSSVR